MQEPTCCDSERLAQADQVDLDEVTKGMKHPEAAQMPRSARVHDMDHLAPDATAGLSPYPGPCSLLKPPGCLGSRCDHGDDRPLVRQGEVSESGQSSIGVDVGCIQSASHSDATAVEPIAGRDGFGSDEHDVHSARCARLASGHHPDVHVHRPI
jgi:hypothetical protein